MLLKPVAFAAAAAAFVIVPELSGADEGIFKALPIHTEDVALFLPATSQEVIVPCKQCDENGANLRLNFEVADGTRLTLNGFELYPNADPWNGDLTAQVLDADNNEKLEKLGYSLAITPEAMDKDQSLQLLDVEVRVIEVGNRFVDSVPVVNVKVVKASTNDLGIARVDAMMAKQSGCSSMACRAKEALGDALRALKDFKPKKGCGRHGHTGLKGHKGHKDHKGHKSNPNMHQDGPHHGHGQKYDGHRNHQHHTGGSHHHEWSQLITNIAAQIFLPVLMGITAGVGVALYVLHLLLPPI